MTGIVREKDRKSRIWTAQITSRYCEAFHSQAPGLPIFFEHLPNVPLGKILSSSLTTSTTFPPGTCQWSLDLVLDEKSSELSKWLEVGSINQIGLEWVLYRDGSVKLESIAFVASSCKKTN